VRQALREAGAEGSRTVRAASGRKLWARTARSTPQALSPQVREGSLTTLPRLTLRKVTVLLHLEAGRSYKQIAAALDVHEETVRAHVQAIADALPGNLPPKERVLLYCQRLLVTHALEVEQIKSAA
jgi:DNA-binding NarL/FixJ family response regulator